jgi:hypothetical protein
MNATDAELTEFLKNWHAFRKVSISLGSAPTYEGFIAQYRANHPVKELPTDDSKWFRKSIAEEMTRKELEDRLVEQNEIINQLRNNVNSLLEADEPKQVTDEQIEKRVSVCNDSLYPFGFVEGAKWMRDQLTKKG